MYAPSINNLEKAEYSSAFQPILPIDPKLLFSNKCNHISTWDLTEQWKKLIQKGPFPSPRENVSLHSLHAFFQACNELEHPEAIINQNFLSYYAVDTTGDGLTHWLGLKKLTLENCKIEYSTDDRIALALNFNHDIQKLTLRNVLYEPKNSSELADAVKKKSIKHLFIDQCIMNQNLADLLRTALNYLPSVSLQISELSQEYCDYIFHGINKNSPLKKLKLTVHSDLVPFLKNLVSHLGKINLLPDLEIEISDHIKSTKHLFLEKTMLKHSNIKKLTKNTALTLENCEFSEELADNLLDALLEGRIIHRLCFHGCKWINNSEKNKATKSLLCLDLSTLQSTEFLQKIHMIKRLTIQSCDIHTSDLPVLAIAFKQLKNLDKLTFKNCFLSKKASSKLATLLFRINTISRLNFSSMRVSNEFLKPFYNEHSKSMITPSLRALTMHDCELSKQGFKSLEKFLCNYLPLERLKLSECGLTYIRRKHFLKKVPDYLHEKLQR